MSLSTAALASPPGWIATWVAPPVPAIASAKGYDNQTIRQVVRVSAGGKRVRIRLSNEYGTAPLIVGAATIARTNSESASVGTPVSLTFNGKSSAIIPVGAPMLIDPVDLPVKALEALSISLFFPRPTVYISAPGDFTQGDFTPASTSAFRLFLTEVEVEPTVPTSVLVAFGDSITDGYRSTLNANHRWPDILAERLGGKVAVANAGISGNRVLAGAGLAGEPALTRFDRDVLSVPGAQWVVVLEGVNDLGKEPRPTFDDLIGGYRQLIDRAHEHGLKVYGATILPYNGYTGPKYYSDDGEKVRKAVNAWLRSKKSAFDGLIDFDAVIRDPTDSTGPPSGLWPHACERPVSGTIRRSSRGAMSQCQPALHRDQSIVDLCQNPLLTWGCG